MSYKFVVLPVTNLCGQLINRSKDLFDTITAASTIDCIHIFVMPCHATYLYILYTARFDNKYIPMIFVTPCKAVLILHSTPGLPEVLHRT